MFRFYYNSGINVTDRGPTHKFYYYLKCQANNYPLLQRLVFLKDKCLPGSVYLHINHITILKYKYEYLVNKQNINISILTV